MVRSSWPSHSRWPGGCVQSLRRPLWKELCVTILPMKFPKKVELKKRMYTGVGRNTGCADKAYELGTVATSEQLVQDLYLSLRRRVNKWAAITHQTAQARMGYVGQHLVSVVTGYSGGRSGARGKDLLLPQGGFAEIKTCYRVDQLGRCNSCGEGVAAIESACPNCDSEDLHRNDDSKWLISIRHDDEFARILEPNYYYLVLFEFTDLSTPNTIQASIWQVDPSVPGFALCMVDYYLNIRASSNSKAPFNLWPYQLKFDLMRPYLIYRSHIAVTEEQVQTLIFPGDTPAQLHHLRPLNEYSRSQNLRREKIVEFARYIGMKDIGTGTKAQLLTRIQRHLDSTQLQSEDVTDSLSKVLYMPEVEAHIESLPSTIRENLKGTL